MNISAGWLGIVRGVLFAAVMAILTYLGDAAHLNGVISESGAAVIATLALGLEHMLEQTSGKAMFGAFKKA